MSINLYTLYESTSKKKKYDVYILNRNGNIKKVSFGAKGYSDFTIHKDIKRRALYRNRHKNDKLHDPTYAGFWSWYVLWGNSSNLHVAFKHTVALAKRLLSHSS